MSLVNFTLCDEDDPASKMNVTASKIDVVGMQYAQAGYVSCDKGVDSIDGDLSYDFEVFVNSSGSINSQINFTLSNAQDDVQGLIDGGVDFLRNAYLRTASTFIALSEYVAGVQITVASSNFLAINTKYYATLSRDLSVGPFGESRIKMFSDADRTVQVDNLAIALSAVMPLQYVQPVTGLFTLGDTRAFIGYIQNLDLKEASVGPLINAGLVNDGLVGGRLCT